MTELRVALTLAQPSVRAEAAIALMALGADAQVGHDGLAAGV